MIENYLIYSECTIKEAMEHLDKVQGLGLIVVDEKKTVLGAVTDGDIRRAVLKGVAVSETITCAMNTNPQVFSVGTPEDVLSECCTVKQINVLPLVNTERVIADIYISEKKIFHPVPVILMAGGLGVRLGELTKNCPKPMLKIGNKPLLEIIIDRFVELGFCDFYISVNYKAEIIEEYFKSGERHNCNISYLHESKRLGTAGSLRLLPDGVRGSLIVMNADLLTKIDFRALLDSHRKSDALATMSVREYTFQVPYGVVDVEDGKARGINEKPVHSFFVNAGVYCLDSSLREEIPENEYFDMPSLLKICAKKGNSPSCFPIVEDWIDIGRKEDLLKAQNFLGEFNV